ncbi:MAG: nucleotidyltransferase family protein [Wenzhouxiangella sp.]
MDSFKQQFEQLNGPAEQLAWLSAHRLLGVASLLADRGLLQPEIHRLAAPLMPSRGWVSAAWLEEERSVLRGLSDAVDCLTLKGCLLAYLVYPAPQQRWRSDLDVLIAPESLPSAREALRGLGYQPMFKTAGGTPIDQESWLRSSPAGRSVVDLHWAMRKHPTLRYCLSFEEQWVESQVLSGLGDNVRGQSHAHALLNAALHWFDGIYAEAPPLGWLLDMDLLWREMIAAERARLLALAQTRGMAGLLAESLRMSRAVFDTPVEQHVIKNLVQHGRKRPATRLIALRERPAMAYLYALWTEPGAAAKARRLRHSLLPSAQHLRERFPEGSRWGAPGLYLKRALRRYRRLPGRVER